jgi:hypothetical protein
MTRIQMRVPCNPSEGTLGRHALGVVSGDDPNCPGKRNLLTALIGLQRAADRRGNRGTRFRGLVLQCAACGADCHRGPDRLFDPASTGNVEIEVARLKYNCVKPGVRKNAVHTLFAGKGEGTWIFGARSRQRWNVFKRGAQRHLKPGIFIELAPTGEGEVVSAWLQRRASKQSAIA